jgi:hypothetical protein
LLLVYSSIKHALGRVYDVIIELHMTFVHVGCIVMDMDDKKHSFIILGRTFLRTIDAIIDAKEGNVNFLRKD